MEDGVYELEERDQRMKEEGLKEGFEKGIELISFLMEKGLIEEVQKAAADKEYAGKLLEKYSIQ